MSYISWVMNMQMKRVSLCLCQCVTLCLCQCVTLCLCVRTGSQHGRRADVPHLLGDEHSDETQARLLQQRGGELLLIAVALIPTASTTTTTTTTTCTDATCVVIIIVTTTNTITMTGTPTSSITTTTTSLHCRLHVSTFPEVLVRMHRQVPLPPFPEVFVCFVGSLTSQQDAGVSQGQICSDNCTCCHTETEVADQPFYLTRSQYTDTGSTSPSADPITPDAWPDGHRSANF